MKFGFAFPRIPYPVSRPLPFAPVSRNLSPDSRLFSPSSVSSVAKEDFESTADERGRGSVLLSPYSVSCLPSTAFPFSVVTRGYE